MSGNFKPSFEPTNDDTIQCLFFSATNLSNYDSSFWEDLCKELNTLILTLSKDYLWHRDEFRIHIPIEDAVTDVPHLYSATCFGDNLEDEWFIVHIIFKLMEIHEDLIVQIKDNDGDFLLIEAADYLPSWANPESTENRVFLHNRHIHMIPPKLASLEEKLELKEALQLIMQSPEETQTLTDIERALLNRIGNYPEKVLENIHKTFVKIPRTLAALLTLKPNLVSPIIDSYFNHDVLDAKCCKNITFDDCITIDVNFTKFLYAMLTHCKLIPYAKCHVRDESDKKTILGLKLWCGYQMIMNRSSNTDIFATKQYTQFLNTLSTNGYFKNNIEGSKDYNELLQRAKDYFSDVKSPVSSHISNTILELQKTDEYVKLKDTLLDHSTEQSNNCEDNEDWLNINPDQLNELLHKRYDKKSTFKSNDVLSSHTITNELSNFLKQSSDYEGVELETDDTSENNEIDFNPSDFVTSLEKMLKILSTNNNIQDNESDLDSDGDIDEDMFSETDDECDKELKTKLQSDQAGDKQDIIKNIVQSIKYENSSTGPASNLLGNLGIRKSDLLDSDDDDVNI